jgi:nicotinate dehydrogenase subunit B
VSDESSRALGALNRSPAKPARREFLRDLKNAGLVVAFSLSQRSQAWAQSNAGAAAGAAPVPRTIAFDGRPLSLAEVDAFLVLHEDGTATVFSGKVDLGTGLRIAMRQMAAEELGLGVDRIELVEGDTALTPDQGPTAGSTGIARGGVQIRQAAACAREALLSLGSTQLGRPAGELSLIDGWVQSSDGASRVRVGQLLGGKSMRLKVDPNVRLKDPARYSVVGKSLPRPDIPAKVTGQHHYVHDIVLPRMMHGRVIRPATIGAHLIDVDLTSIGRIPGIEVLQRGDFLGVVAEDEWAVVRAARELQARWSDTRTLPQQSALAELMRGGPFVRDEVIVNQGDTGPLAAGKPPPGDRQQADGVQRAQYFWPMQSHASIGPSAAVADVKPDSATIWSASQATHRYHLAFAAMLRLAPDKVRVIYIDGSGCYGMNGHDDAAADAVLLAQATGRPMRVQWSREDELGWDPKGPPQLLQISAMLDDIQRIRAWEAEMWFPMATANLEHVPLLGPQAAGLPQPVGQSVGLISQNTDPPYAAANVRSLAHWIERAPLRPSNIRAPGKVANCWAVETMADRLAAAARLDPIEFRLRGLADPRAIDVLTRVAAMFRWAQRPSPGPDAGATSARARGRGVAFVHYKHNETYVATAIEVEVDRASGAIRVLRVCCAHDCGLMINPDNVRAQVEGNILQTLSRTLFEEVVFDRTRVTSVDWASYPILRFGDVPELSIELIDRPALPPLGAGEAAATPVPGALANAIFDATGVWLQKVPFRREQLLAAMQRR